MIDAAAGRGQAGTVRPDWDGFRTSRLDQLPAAHMFHAITSLHRTGRQDFTARMIAAEALSRTSPEDAALGRLVPRHDGSRGGFFATR